MKSTFRMNMNDRVRVKLTDKGADILSKSYMGQRTLTGGVFETQLWVLMQIFGEHIFNGCDIPFDENVVEIDIGTVGPEA